MTTTAKPAAAPPQQPQSPIERIAAGYASPPQPPPPQHNLTPAELSKLSPVDRLYLGMGGTWPPPTGSSAHPAPIRTG